MITTAIQSNKKLQFPPASVGYVKMEIDLIQNKPTLERYELRIVDTCFDYVLEKQLKKGYVSQEDIEPTDDDYEDVEVIKILGTNTRFKHYSYDELRQLSQMLPNVEYDNEIDKINALFQLGLLITTQGECVQGISGEGLGMYFSKSTDWELCEI
ncbi:MAG TPA: hypothetical protein DCS19_13030 [Flavobacterium sp.]|nr:hypothetical protein [Flavobacterium sp.]